MSENLKKIGKQHLHHHILFGRVSRKIFLAHPKTNFILIYQKRLELQMGLSQIKKKKKKKKKKTSFLAANTQDGFVEHRYKKYPMCTMKYTDVFLMLWAYFSARGPDLLTWGEPKRRSTVWSWESEVILEEGMISCQVFSSLIRHYWRKCYCDQCVLEKNIYFIDISTHFKFLLSKERFDFCDFFK